EHGEHVKEARPTGPPAGPGPSPPVEHGPVPILPTASRTRRVESDGAGRVPPPGPSGSWGLERSWAPRLLDTLQDVDGLSRFLQGCLRVGLAQEVLLGGGKEGFLDPLPVLDGGRLG